jgi:hypothetical protein
MAIKSFTFDPELTHAFARFGYELYRDDPDWIPLQRDELHSQLAPEFPFYRKAGNSHRHFLATVGRRIVGRISAFVNSDLRDRDGTPAAAIGFFESVEDNAIARGLFDSAAGWLRAEHGIRRIWGPMNFDIWHGYRLMTRGFGQKSFYGEPYNKVYYPALFERYGFARRQYWHSVELTGQGPLEKMIAPGAARYDKLIEQGYRFERFNAPCLAMSYANCIRS